MESTSFQRGLTRARIIEGLTPADSLAPLCKVGLTKQCHLTGFGIIR